MKTEYVHANLFTEAISENLQELFVRPSESDLSTLSRLKHVRGR